MATSTLVVCAFVAFLLMVISFYKKKGRTMAGVIGSLRIGVCTLERVFTLSSGLVFIHKHGVDMRGFGTSAAD